MLFQIKKFFGTEVKHYFKCSTLLHSLGWKIEKVHKVKQIFSKLFLITGIQKSFHDNISDFLTKNSFIICTYKFSLNFQII